MGWKRSGLLVSFVAAVICLGARDLAADFEGWAELWIVVAESGIVVCHKWVSGAERELFALDTMDKKVLWRVKDHGARRRGEVDGRGNFLVVDSDEMLVSRKLRTGEVNFRQSIGGDKGGQVGAKVSEADGKKTDEEPLFFYN